MRAVFETLGMQDVVAKSLGSSNPYNMVRATFDALEAAGQPAFGRGAPRPQGFGSASARGKVDAEASWTEGMNGDEQERKDRHRRADRQRRSAVQPSSAATLIGLGLNKIGRSATLEDTPPCAA